MSWTRSLLMLKNAIAFHTTQAPSAAPLEVKSLLS